jgi:hypothetical protein
MKPVLLGTGTPQRTRGKDKNKITAFLKRAYFFLAGMKVH